MTVSFSVSSVYSKINSVLKEYNVVDENIREKFQKIFVNRNGDITEQGVALMNGKISSEEFSNMIWGINFQFKLEKNLEVLDRNQNSQSYVTSPSSVSSAASPVLTSSNEKSKG
jgi:hypothetical protein